MNVLIVVSTSEAVGVAVHVRELVVWVISQGWCPVVVLPKEGWLSSELQSMGVNVVAPSLRYPSSLGLLAVAMGNLTRRYAREVELVHAHGRLALLACWMGTVGRQRSVRVATIHQAHNLRTGGGQSLFGYVEVLLYRRMARVWFVSRHLADAWHPVLKIPGRRVHVIPNWTRSSLSTFTGVKPRGKQVRLLGVGRLSPEKNWAAAVEVLQVLRSRGVNVSLSLIGSGPCKSSLVQLGQRLGVTEYLNFCGAVDNAYTFMPDYDCLVIPSLVESFGLVSLEGFACGLPVVANNIPGLAETVGDAALLVDFGDVGAAAGQIAGLMDSPLAQEAQVRRGLDRVGHFQMSPGLSSSIASFYDAPKGC